MSVQVAVCTAAQLFSPALWAEEKMCDAAILTKDGTPVSGRLCIPEYQRPYRWGEKQIEALLNDLREHKEHNENHTDLHYYLGSLILHQQGNNLNIIDGQQRITTLALLASQLGDSEQKIAALLEGLQLSHEISHQQIRHNLKWIQARLDSWQPLINLERLQFTLVITQSEDDAYRFFETQNSGGVRLSGENIIKAHHLRAIANNENLKPHLKQFALQWERLGELEGTIDALLKGRYWQAINMRELPSHRQNSAVRDSIVSELAQQTGTGHEDIGYGRSYRQEGLAGEIQQHFAQQGYEMRQPLNAGINTIRYLAYFQGLQHRYWDKPNLPHLPDYQKFVMDVAELKGCDYLRDFYKACLLLYISQFGEENLDLAARKLFRVAYSLRVSNQKVVREASVPKFVREHPVLDWIALSYTSSQLFTWLDNFKLEVDPNNLGEEMNSVKKSFIHSVNKIFALELSEKIHGQALADAFGERLTRAVTGSPK